MQCLRRRSSPKSSHSWGSISVGCKFWGELRDPDFPLAFLHWQLNLEDCRVQLEHSVGQYFCRHLHLWPASLIRMVCASGEFQNKNWLWVFCHSLILLRSRKDYQWLPVTAGTRNSSKDAEAWHIRICCSRSLADAALYRWWSTPWLPLQCWQLLVAASVVFGCFREWKKSAGKPKRFGGSTMLSHVKPMVSCRCFQRNQSEAALSLSSLERADLIQRRPRTALRLMILYGVIVPAKG